VAEEGLIAMDPWTHHVATVNDFRMHYVIAGAGYPLVLLHGWPQSWYEWRKIIPRLAERFTIIAPDLRGLGNSERPMTGYDKRTLASDVRALMRSLGFSRIGLTGHDWGGVVAFYLAYDYPEMVERLMILDAIPGLGRTDGTIDRQMARRLWHVFFHAGIPDLAETLVGANVEAYLSYFFTSTVYNYSPTVFSSEDIAEYVRVYSAPGALRAAFQYYRTALREDLDNMNGCTRKLTMPVLAWGGEAFLGNIVGPWATVAGNVQGGEVKECGHFIAEEKPDFVIQQTLEFFASLQQPR
jgi:pimeloyl-ACP methyl ester carboxylesterase